MSYDDIHRDEAPQLRQQLEQGELIEDEGSVTEDLPPNTDMAKTIQLLQRKKRAEDSGYLRRRLGNRQFVQI